MKSEIVIIDFSHLFHVCRSIALKSPPETDLVDETTTRLVGMLRAIKSTLAKNNINGYDLVFVEDRLPERKLALLPTYRQGREDLREEKNQVKQYLLQNGSITRFCHSAGNEADDVIASLCRLVNEQQSYHITVITGDKDIWQLIQDNISIYNPLKHVFITEANILAKFRGCRAIHIALYKSLWGDYGDRIPNLMPRTHKQLIPIILKTDGSLNMFKERIEMIGDKYYMTPKCYDRWLENLPGIEINWQLVKLDDQCEMVWE